MLASRDVWRRALLAAILAAAVANCWRATRQQVWEYEETWQHYVQNKAEYWAKHGKSLDDPTIEIFESRIKAQPAIRLLLPSQCNGLVPAPGHRRGGGWPAGSGVCLGRGGRQRRRTSPHGRKPPYPATHGPAAGSPVLQGPPSIADKLADPLVGDLPRCVLAAIILWQLIVIYWVGSVGAKAGLAAGIAGGAARVAAPQASVDRGPALPGDAGGPADRPDRLAVGADSVVPGLARARRQTQVAGLSSGLLARGDRVVRAGTRSPASGRDSSGRPTLRSSPFVPPRRSPMPTIGC